MACGRTLADAAWAAVNWDLRTMAAAIANERAKRHTRPASLSEGDLAKLRGETDAAHKPPHPPKAQADDPDHANHAQAPAAATKETLIHRLSSSDCA